MTETLYIMPGRDAQDYLGATIQAEDKEELFRFSFDLIEASATCFDVKWVCVDNKELNGLLENVNGSSRFAMMMSEWEHELD